ncbi:MAG: hypothetical protein PHE02_13260 [Lachnospiraceae bacterium]|nr:hypothetical protein [Lachnospiraceae bacterium]
MMNKYRRTIQSFLPFCLIIMMAVCSIPLQVKAAGNGYWDSLGGGRHQLNGTQVVADMTKPGILHITGTGEIPDYKVQDLNRRPWHTSSIEALIIDPGITFIGEFSFSHMKDLKYITICTTTFVRNWNVFCNIKEKPIFRVQNTGVTTEMIGTVPYTSYDSLKAMGQLNSEGGATFVFDDHAKASDFQASSNPTIRNVFAATDSVNNTVPWTKLETYGNGHVYDSECSISDKTPNINYIVTGGKWNQGRDFYVSLAAFIGDNTLAGTYRFTLSMRVGETIIKKTNQPYQYVLKIPESLQKPGRQFRLLGVNETPGQMTAFNDLDNMAQTVTFSTDYPTTSYALVYKDLS